MDLIVASSRGKNIGHHLINPNLSIPIKTYYKSSASITSLATMASQITLQYNKHPTQKVHVYFLAGLPDITSFERSSDGMYQEVVIRETAEEASLRVIQTIREAEVTVKELGAIPIFCTVAPMSLKTWISKRLQQQMISEMCFLYFMFSFFSSLNAHSPMAENTSWIPNRYPQYIMYIVVLYAMLRQHRRKVFTSPSHNGVSYML